MSTKAPGFSENRQAEIDRAEPPQPRWLSKADLDTIGSKADAWLAAHGQLVDSLPHGAILMVEVETGGYEAGPDHEQVRQRFQARFGPSAVGFVHRVGMPYYVGAGLWAPRSEA